MSILEVAGGLSLLLWPAAHHNGIGQICQPIDLDTSSQKLTCKLRLINIYHTSMVVRACRQYFVCDGKKKYTRVFSLRYAHRIDTAAAVAHRRGAHTTSHHKIYIWLINGLNIIGDILCKLIIEYQ